jgi:hypothetical protein
MTALVPYILTAHFWADLGFRFHGPGGFRFIVQPIGAIILGIRDGKLDAAAGTPPYLYDLLFVPEDRAASVRSGLSRLTIPIIVAIVLDAVFQYIIINTVRPVAAIVVGIFLMGVPYSLSRAITNRIVSSGRGHALHASRHSAA